MARGRHGNAIVIAAADPELHCWCATCQLPIRMRLPVHLGDSAGPLLAVIEICPGCGTGHDRPAVTATPAMRDRPLDGTSLTRLARRLHGWRCRRRGLPAVACTFGECQWPGLWRHAAVMAGEDGTWRYLFCRKAHKRKWAIENGIVIPGIPVELPM